MWSLKSGLGFARLSLYEFFRLFSRPASFARLSLHESFRLFSRPASFARWSLHEFFRLFSRPASFARLSLYESFRLFSRPASFARLSLYDLSDYSPGLQNTIGWEWHPRHNWVTSIFKLILMYISNIQFIINVLGIIVLHATNIITEYERLGDFNSILTLQISVMLILKYDA